MGQRLVPPLPGEGRRAAHHQGAIDVFIEQNWELIQKIVNDGGIASIDRKDASGHYELGNIRIIPHIQNSSRREEYARLDINNLNDLDAEVLAALEECDGNRTYAAAKLGISVRTLQRSLKRQAGLCDVEIPEGRTHFHKPAPNREAAPAPVPAPAKLHHRLTDAEIDQIKSELAGKIWV